jgi:hypothetical protein
MHVALATQRQEEPLRNLSLITHTQHLRTQTSTNTCTYTCASPPRRAQYRRRDGHAGLLRDVRANLALDCVLVDWMRPFAPDHRMPGNCPSTSPLLLAACCVMVCCVMVCCVMVCCVMVCCVMVCCMMVCCVMVCCVLCAVCCVLYVRVWRPVRVRRLREYVSGLQASKPTRCLS